MYMSRPALTAAGQFVAVQPGICAWPFQSPTMKPWKPIRPFSTPVSRLSLPCILRPCQLENDAITVMTPASTAGG
jgi:hypothetical protein